MSCTIRLAYRYLILEGKFIKRKKYLARWLHKVEMLNPQKVFLKLLMALLEPSQITKMELFVRNLNNIKSLTASHLKLL